jgi:hypothetical protein
MDIMTICAVCGAIGFLVLAYVKGAKNDEEGRE